MPAVTFMHSTTHSSQNCGVRQATSTATCAWVTNGAGFTGRVHPSGCQPSAGTLTKYTPIIMYMK